METKWTPEKIEELMAATRKHIAERDYAQAIADWSKELDEIATCLQQYGRQCGTTGQWMDFDRLS